MWIICNGANKMGSVWLSQTLISTGLTVPIPSKFRDARWKAPSVSDEMINQALIDLSGSSKIFISKQHWKHDPGVTKGDGTIVLNIIRDMRDTIVSRYHHDCRLNEEKRPIDEYIKDYSEALVRARCNYHRNWLNATKEHHNKYHVACFEQVVQDGAEAVRGLLAACQISINSTEFERVVSEQKYENKKVKGDNQHLRKGKAFGFKNEISELDEEIILDHCAKYKLQDIKKRIAERNPNLSQYLAKTDVGV